MPEETKQKVIKEFMEAQLFEPWSEDVPQVWRLNDECYLITYDNLEKETGIKRSYLKPILIELRNDGLIELCPAVNQDGIPNGSGYMLTKKGLEFINLHFPYQPIHN